MPNPTQHHLDHAITTAKQLETEGYFERARAGDRRAASLFARLAAFRLNPHGATNGWGWLSKSPSETNVDGYAEDAIVFSADDAARENVADLVAGAGAPGASIPDAPIDAHERREHNRWVKPESLSIEEMAYLLSGGQPQPGPTPEYPPYQGDETFDVVGEKLFADYATAGYPPDSQMGRWFGRTDYDFLTGKVTPMEASVEKHRLEWRETLNQRRASNGLPPIAWS